jgi:YesN/AraC family two-component response regulator
LQLILLTVLRCSTPQPVCTESTAEKIQTVARYMSQNYRFPITLHDAAQMACLEDSYFSRQFKSMTGFGFLDYLTRIRIQEAQQLLRTTALPLEDISDLCGFSSRNYFGDVFKRYIGLSPTAYRKTNKT